jgi:hypothetical protein
MLFQQSMYYVKLKLVQIIFKNSVRASKRTPHFTITKINWLMLVKKVISVYDESHREFIHKNMLQIEKPGCIYSYHLALKG